MINFFKNLGCLAIILICPMQILALNANTASIDIQNGNIVAVWQSQDEFGNVLTQGATGTIANANALNISTISDGLNSGQNTPPVLRTNANGDAVAIWQYVDASAFTWVAASTLQNGDVAWNTTTISNADDTGAFYDQKVSLDNQGNILAYWSSYVESAGENQVRGATAIMGPGSITWSAPFSISSP